MRRLCAIPRVGAAPAGAEGLRAVRHQPVSKRRWSFRSSLQSTTQRLWLTRGKSDRVLIADVSATSTLVVCGVQQVGTGQPHKHDVYGSSPASHTPQHCSKGYERQFVTTVLFPSMQ
mmetsp:Transcript_77812/g.129828  ORF Transcript_77812/g.129828 Transcript_77812/m.129828 type:complete len:117 (-) Transcript_77812:487-837(-)